MKLEIGKRYIRRDGKISAKIERVANGCFPDHVFRDTVEGWSYTVDGIFSPDGSKDVLDLVAPYRRPRVPKPPRASNTRWVFSVVSHGETVENVMIFHSRMRARGGCAAYGGRAGTSCGPIVRISVPKAKP